MSRHDSILMLDGVNGGIQDDVSPVAGPDGRATVR